MVIARRLDGAAEGAPFLVLRRAWFWVSYEAVEKDGHQLHSGEVGRDRSSAGSDGGFLMSQLRNGSLRSSAHCHPLCAPPARPIIW